MPNDQPHLIDIPNNSIESMQRDKSSLVKRAHKSSLHRSIHAEQDTNLLQKAVSDAGRWTYGIVFVEVWALSNDQTFLYRPESGYWIDPVFHSTCEPNCAVCRLIDPTVEGYVAPFPLVPGEGLAGALWAEATEQSVRYRRKVQSVRRAVRQTLLRRNPRQESLYAGEPENTVAASRRSVYWRDIRQLASDPDQPWDPRIKVMVEAGLNWAAGVPFNFSNQEGIVVYLARRGVDMKRLHSDTNEAYLWSASDLIGAAFALRHTRHVQETERRKVLSVARQKVKRGLLKLAKNGGKLPEDNVDLKVASEETEGLEKPRLKCSDWESMKDFLSLKAMNMLKKMRGGGGTPPPSMSFVESLFSFAGVFVTLSVVFIFQTYLTRTVGSSGAILSGPLGSLMVCLYGFAAAPASQPRSAFCGQAVSITIGISVAYATSLPSWLRQTISCSLATLAMAKLGVLHPPAGGSAISLAAGGYTWITLGSTLAGYVMAMAMATYINNLSNRRQYPNYWGVEYIDSKVRHLMQDEETKAKKTN